jgi:hypothetical protein
VSKASFANSPGLQTPPQLLIGPWDRESAFPGTWLQGILADLHTSLAARRGPSPPRSFIGDYLPMANAKSVAQSPSQFILRCRASLLAVAMSTALRPQNE